MRMRRRRRTQPATEAEQQPAAFDGGAAFDLTSNAQASFDIPTEEMPDAEVVDLQRYALEARAHLHQLCRDDVNTFCEYVLRDDETGEPIEQHAFHVQLQRELDESGFIVVMSHPESGKSTQLAVGRVLWELGRNPRLRVALLNATQDGAKKSLNSIKRYIETSEELHAVFPHLKRGDVWRDDRITVARDSYSRDFSVQCVGADTKGIVGSRVDLLIVDDLLTEENTYTEAQRKKLSKWFRGNSIMGRLTRAARAAFLTNAWHPLDLSHELVRERGWKLIQRPVYDEKTRELSWPSRWDWARIKKAQKLSGPLEFARVYMCKPRDEGSLIWKSDDIEKCQRRGRHNRLIKFLDHVPNRSVLVMGVDIGSRRHDGGLSVIFVLFIHPNGDRQPLWIEAGRWGPKELLRRIVSCGIRFPGIIAVESNGLQRHLVDLAIENDETVLPIIPFQTGKNKIDPRFGVSAMAAEFETGRWIIPGVDGSESESEQALLTWIAEMLDYVPDKHTGDHLMACWIAREVGRKLHARLFGSASAGTVGARVIG